MGGYKYTPGMWFAASADMQQIWADSRKVAPICTIGPDRQDGELSLEDMANADIIAAAPIMFEALEDVWEMLNRTLHDIEDGVLGVDEELRADIEDMELITRFALDLAEKAPVFRLKKPPEAAT